MLVSRRPGICTVLWSTVSTRFSGKAPNCIGWLLIQGLSRCHLAKILRVAPGLNERANVNLPDAETLRAVLTHRFQALTEYYRKVVLPILGDELQSLPVR